MRLLPLLIATAAVGLAQSPQPTGSVSGRVVRRADGGPVRGAFVLATQNVQEKGLAWTGQDGRFQVDGLTPGTYSILAGKPGYGTLTRNVEVQSSEDTRDIVFAVEAPAVLAGSVRDEEDLPIEGVRIDLQGFAWLHGRPLRFDVADLLTDDRGEFRAAPRSAKPVFLALQPPSHPEEAGRYRLLHPPLFFPNAVNPAEAQPVRVAPGTKLETLDFEVPAPADTTLRITTRTAKQREVPRACPSCRFSVLARNGQGWLEVLQGQANLRGLIEIEGLQPGNYRVAIADDIGSDEYAGYADTFVQAGKVRNEEITAWAGASVRVQVTLADPPEELLKRPWSALMGAAQLEPSYPVQLRGGSAEIKGTGGSASGRLELAPGEWALRVEMPGRPYIEQVLVAGRPQRGPFVRVTKAGFGPPIEVRVGFATARVSGKVNGLPDFDPSRDQLRAFVFAIPDPGESYARQEETSVVRGEFELQALAPGEYLLFALPPGGSEFQFQLDLADPAVQSRYVSYGKRISVKPGDSLRVELDVIP